jgi:hypothetical protein
MRDVLRNGVFAADLGDADVRGLAGLGESVVARVEILALLVREALAIVVTDEILKGARIACSKCRAIPNRALIPSTYLELVLQ